MRREEVGGIREGDTKPFLHGGRGLNKRLFKADGVAPNGGGRIRYVPVVELTGRLGVHGPSVPYSLSEAYRVFIPRQRHGGVRMQRSERFFKQ